MSEPSLAGVSRLKEMDEDGIEEGYPSAAGRVFFWLGDANFVGVLGASKLSPKSCAEAYRSFQ